MNTSCWLIICSLFFTVGITGKSARANNPDYEQRRTAYIDSALANFSDDAVTLQAYRGLPVDTQALHNLLAAVPVKSTSDFDIVKLIRILFFTNGTYDAQILPVLASVPFWLTKGDKLRVYWSENHMIMWMSSHWLLHERYGWPMDSSLSSRLRHYLRLKIHYGFYEFFSSTYAPYTLSGLLNLTDFAQDTEVKNLATQAAIRLLKDLLMPVNDKGVFYPVAGRNYYSKYEDPYHQNHHHLVYLLTGLGQPPVGASHSGGFLASSSIPVDSIIASWSPVLDTVYSIGHSLDSISHPSIANHA
ncbi:MAG: hypothetical protein KatS3mg031_0720 [Chitinophagales bacterium]|nr:MAG: hypothetical protein KatS3mg031_0720 [Chitinophagales bacterium]